MKIYVAISREVEGINKSHFQKKEMKSKCISELLTIVQL